MKGFKYMIHLYLGDILRTIFCEIVVQGLFYAIKQLFKK
jgi:hypothetical protein